MNVYKLFLLFIFHSPLLFASEYANNDREVTNTTAGANSSFSFSTIVEHNEKITSTLDQWSESIQLSASWVVSKLQSLSTDFPEVYETVKLESIQNARTFRGVYHDNTFLRLLISSPYLVSATGIDDLPTQEVNVLLMKEPHSTQSNRSNNSTTDEAKTDDENCGQIMTKQSTKYRSCIFAIDQFPIMNPNILNNYSNKLQNHKDRKRKLKSEYLMHQYLQTVNQSISEQAHQVGDSDNSDNNFFPSDDLLRLLDYPEQNEIHRQQYRFYRYSVEQKQKQKIMKQQKIIEEEKAKLRRFFLHQEQQQQHQKLKEQEMQQPQHDEKHEVQVEPEEEKQHPDKRSNDKHEGYEKVISSIQVKYY